MSVNPKETPSESDAIGSAALRFWRQSPDYDASISEKTIIGIARAAAAAAGQSGFQERTYPFFDTCFSDEDVASPVERNYRFFEEATEFVQSLNMPKAAAQKVLDEVYKLPIGRPFQEAGGVMLSLAAICRTAKIEMYEAGEAELARVWTKVDLIRIKQKTKVRTFENQDSKNRLKPVLIAVAIGRNGSWSAYGGPGSFDTHRQHVVESMDHEAFESGYHVIQLSATIPLPPEDPELMETIDFVEASEASNPA